MLLPMVLLALAVTVTDYGALLIRCAWKEERSGEEGNEKVGARAHVNARERMCLHVYMNEIGGEHDGKRGELRIDRVARGWSNRQPGRSVFYTGASCVERMRENVKGESSSSRTGLPSVYQHLDYINYINT